MKYKDFFISTENIQESLDMVNISESYKPEDLLRNNNIKIKLITVTSFGIQIDLAKKYSEDLIKETLKNFKIKIKGNSIFVETR